MSTVLLIGGSDPSGGAGVLRDALTVHTLGGEVLCALTAVTAQSDRTFLRSATLPPELVRAQLEAACATRPPAAVKIGMLGSAAVVEAVLGSFGLWGHAPVVLDPVLESSSGGTLLDEEGRERLRRDLLPRVTLLTPNVAEAAALLRCAPAGDVTALEQQAAALGALGARAVLMKGGHLAGLEAIDVLWQVGAAPLRLGAVRLAQGRRGTGCALASAIAACLAQGLPLAAACTRAKHFITQHIQHAP
ncbi:MAG: hydroxymethylpyrimidine/phosphomethylpyrimidine kinase [Gammaproteobacteria bacterium]|nr:hydroxymethylpyrimidine/phosphomethylpyrimidine kinase [Gammaproteobacteria bacterium]MBV9698210.1 hydroxymethylpyrimidine/phosphomethylpyrimidine kinase [Gammaproteobacteria bacterium]